QYLRPYRGIVITALLLTIGLSMVRQIGPLLTKLAIEWYVALAATGTLTIDNAATGVIYLALAYLGSLIVTLSVGYFQTLLLNTSG
ncbi:MAG: hypothetical protein ACKOB4_05980, partial [Acidobacteriota bacterium]